MPKTQDYKNHGRMDPSYHLFAFPVMLINAIVVIVYTVRHPSALAAWAVVVSLALVVAVFKLRMYALRNQDRLIRLEESLRLQALLPDPLRGRIGELTTQQCIGLRFACDAEVPALVERTLREKLDKKQIKQSIQTWRADYNRV